MKFEWHPDNPPPDIRPTSKAKLDVLRSYLRAYFDRLNVNPNREIFKLDLVDGFAGGGTFQDGDKIISGTPLIMLEETRAARDRLNERRTKQLHFDCNFHFVDIAKNHTDHLRQVIQRGHQVEPGSVGIHNSPFREVADKIIAQVANHQPKSGRAIFLLDQSGYSRVELEIVGRIFQALPAAEVILTFAADSLVNHLPATPDLIKSIEELELTESQLHDLVRYRDGDGGRALIQRTLREHLRTHTGAPFDTPFFIRAESRRALWFLHLSRHPTARDVMIQRHWAISNTFEHYGPGDFGMLGWDVLRNVATMPLFRFGEAEVSQIHEQLLTSLPREIFALASEGPVTVQELRYVVANRTAARFSDLDSVILQLAREKEIEIRSPDGKVRSRALKRLLRWSRFVGQLKG